MNLKKNENQPFEEVIGQLHKKLINPELTLYVEENENEKFIETKRFSRRESNALNSYNVCIRHIYSVESKEDFAKQLFLKSDYEGVSGIVEINISHKDYKKFKENLSSKNSNFSELIEIIAKSLQNKGGKFEINKLPP